MHFLHFFVFGFLVRQSHAFLVVPKILRPLEFFFSGCCLLVWWMRGCTWTRKLMRMTAGKGTTNKPNIEKEDDTLRKLAFACLERKWNQHLDRWSKQTNATCNKSQISFRYVLWYRYRYPLISIGTLVVLSFEIFYCSLKDTVAKQRKRGNIET